MENKKLSLTLMIPDVSLLLVYKDNWNKIKVMRKVIAELLRNGFYNEIQTAGKTEIQCNHQLLGLEDCAIISLELSGELEKDEIKNPKLVFAKALENMKNIMRFDSAMVSELHKVSYIEIAMKLLKPCQLQRVDPYAA